MSATDFFVLVIGFCLGFISDILAEALFPSIYAKYRSWRLQRFANAKQQAFRSPVNPHSMVIAGLPVEWTVIERANYFPGRIRCTYDDRPFVMEPEFQQMLKELRQTYEELRSQGKKTPWDSSMYKVLEFGAGYREIVEGMERPVLPLSFGPTSYYESIVTDQNTTNHIRNRYERQTDVTQKPVPQFSSILGINLGLVTKDGFLIITRRGEKVHTASNSLHTSMHENMLRPVDSAPDGTPDPFRCAIRGVLEELGLVLEYESISFFAFGVHPSLCEYSLLGWSRVPYTREEVMERWRNGIPKDKTENRELEFVAFNPTSVADYVLSHWKDWFSIGLATTYLTLYQSYSEKEIEAAFLHARAKHKV